MKSLHHTLNSWADIFSKSSRNILRKDSIRLSSDLGSWWNVSIIESGLLSSLNRMRWLSAHFCRPRNQKCKISLIGVSHGTLTVDWIVIWTPLMPRVDLWFEGVDISTAVSLHISAQANIKITIMRTSLTLTFTTSSLQDWLYLHQSAVLCTDIFCIFTL